MISSDFLKCKTYSNPPILKNLCWQNYSLPLIWHYELSHNYYILSFFISGKKDKKVDKGCITYYTAPEFEKGKLWATKGRKASGPDVIRIAGSPERHYNDFLPTRFVGFFFVESKAGMDLCYC